jgi:N6-adenosine-specific RNA methylase IME4
MTPKKAFTFEEEVEHLKIEIDMVSSVIRNLLADPDGIYEVSCKDAAKLWAYRRDQAVDMWEALTGEEYSEGQR